MGGFANVQSTCARLVQSEMNFMGAVVQSGKTTTGAHLDTKGQNDARTANVGC